MSLSLPRPIATAGRLGLIGLALLMASPLPVAAAAPPLADATWVRLGELPEKQDSAIFAIAVSPTDASVLLVGSATGRIFRSADSGTTWKQVATGLGRGVAVIAYSPLRPGLVLAGTRGAGIWRSADGGLTWSADPGTRGAAVRAFGFARSTTIAGTDGGVLVSRDGTAWAPSGLAGLAISAVAVAAVNEPAKFVAGADSTRNGEALPLYISNDSGDTWTLLKGLGSSAVVSAASAGPLNQAASVRPLVVGTDAGAYVSGDTGATWGRLASLPAVDINATAFVSNHPERLYLASDGGGTAAGGLWITSDSGATTRDLAVPVRSVSALAISADADNPTLYVATFRGEDHTVFLFGLRDTGATPQGPAGGVPTPVVVSTPDAGQPTSSARTSDPWWLRTTRGPEAPYLGLAAGAILVLLLALLANVRRGGR